MAGYSAVTPLQYFETSRFQIQLNIKSLTSEELCQTCFLKLFVSFHMSVTKAFALVSQVPYVNFPHKLYTLCLVKVVVFTLFLLFSFCFLYSFCEVPRRQPAAKQESSCSLSNILILFCHQLDDHLPLGLNACTKCYQISKQPFGRRQNQRFRLKAEVS